MLDNRWIGLMLLAISMLSCGLPSFVAQAPEATPSPVKTLRPTFTTMPSATPTLPPTQTAEPTATLLPTDTPFVPTETPEPPTSIPPTDTLPPPTATLAPPTATRVPVKPTKAPPTATPAPKARHVVGSHGVSGLVTARDKTTFSVGEKAFFVYEAINHTQDPVGFVKLGIKANDAVQNTSWINPDAILPGVPFKHDDGLTFNSPGTYKVRLFICFARCDEPDGDWEEFPAGAATITVK